MVPPVATAVVNLKKQYNQNQGANEVAIPLNSCRRTAVTNGIRRPILKIMNLGHKLYFTGTAIAIILILYSLISHCAEHKVPKHYAKHENQLG